MYPFFCKFIVPNYHIKKCYFVDDCTFVWVCGWCLTNANDANGWWEQRLSSFCMDIYLYEETHDNISVHYCKLLRFFFKFDQSLEILLSLLLLLYLTFLKKFYVLLTSSPATKDNTFDKCMKKETKKLITSWKIHDTHSKISFFLYYDYFTLL